MAEKNSIKNCIKSKCNPHHNSSPNKDHLSNRIRESTSFVQKSLSPANCTDDKRTSCAQPLACSPRCTTTADTCPSSRSHSDLCTSVASRAGPWPDRGGNVSLGAGWRPYNVCSWPGRSTANRWDWPLQMSRVAVPRGRSARSPWRNPADDESSTVRRRCNSFIYLFIHVVEEWRSSRGRVAEINVLRRSIYFHDWMDDQAEGWNDAVNHLERNGEYTKRGIGIWSMDTTCVRLWLCRISKCDCEYFFNLLREREFGWGMAAIYHALILFWQRTVLQIDSFNLIKTGNRSKDRKVEVSSAAYRRQFGRLSYFSFPIGGCGKRVR